jgi:hypothetical protein
VRRWSRGFDNGLKLTWWRMPSIRGCLQIVLTTLVDNRCNYPTSVIIILTLQLVKHVEFRLDLRLVAVSLN